MGKKYYTPDIDDNEHLLPSKTNPKKVRGLSRDENNKNPDIPEWEEVSVDEILSSEKLDIERIVQEERLIEQQNKQQKLDIALGVLNGLNNLLTFLNDHPQIIESAVLTHYRLKESFSDAKKKIKSKLHRGKGNADNTNRGVQSNEIVQAESLLEEPLKKDTYQVDLYDVAEDDSDYFEVVDIEEARIRVLRTLSSYIEYKRNLHTLQRTKLRSGETIGLSSDEIVYFMEDSIKKHPELMDHKMILSVSHILQSNENKLENQRIFEALGVDEFKNIPELLELENES